MTPLPPLRALQVFEAVGHYASFSRAAQRLGISVGAVSQHMKLLESALDVSLTVKEGQRIRLSAVGERFHARCTSAFEELRAAAEEVERTRTSASLHISSLPSIMTKWLAPLMYDWSRNHHRIEIHLDSTVEDTSEAEGADFRIGYGEERGGLESRAELFRDCVVPVCAPALLDGAAPIEGPERLLAYPLIRIDSKPKFDSPPSWREWFESCGCRPEKPVAVSFSCSSSSLAIQAAIDVQGVVLAQYSMIAADLHADRLVLPFHHAMELPSAYYVSWHRNALYKPQCQDFQRWIIARGRDQQRAIQDLVARNQASVS